MDNSLNIKEEFWSDFSDLLYDRCWSGAIDTLKDIEEEFMDYLNEVFFDEQPVDLTELNDFIWFERDAIYEACGLDENGELIEEVVE